MTANIGRVVVLNGGSSAGKTTLALALQAVLDVGDRPWVIFGWDDFMPHLPERWCGGPDGSGERAEDGCSYRLVQAEPREAVLAVGDVGWRMLQAYHRAVAAFARSGINVIVDEVLITPAEWDDWQDALAGVDVCWVAVRCDADTVERREHERGDRYPGLARGTAAVTHQYPSYDIEVDTGSGSADAIAAEIERFVAG